MHSCHDVLCSYATWILARRVAQGWPQDDERTAPEWCARFPNEVATMNTLVLGEDYNNAEITIWRTDGDYLTKTLEEKVYSGRVENGEVNIANASIPHPAQLDWTI